MKLISVLHWKLVNHKLIHNWWEAMFCEMVDTSNQCIWLKTNSRDKTPTNKIILWIETGNCHSVHSFRQLDNLLKVNYSVTNLNYVLGWLIKTVFKNFCKIKINATNTSNINVVLNSPSTNFHYSQLQESHQQKGQTHYDGHITLLVTTVFLHITCLKWGKIRNSPVIMETIL